VSRIAQRQAFAGRPGPLRRTPGSLGADRLLGEADGERGFAFARRTGGERALPVDRGLVLLSPGRLCRHLLVCGATGSGKTETLLRLAWAVAKCSDAPVFYLDGKGDRETARRFVALMEDAARRARVFPNEPVDGWRGDGREVHGRLMEVIDYASEGPAAWYRDIAKNVLRLVCEHPDGPPRSSSQTLARMDLDALAEAHPASSTLKALTASQVAQVRLRYEAFFGQTRGVLDGGWAWEETPAAYLLLDSLTMREETVGLARFLFEDFAHYFTTRKPRGRFALLIVDEFSTLAGAGGMAARVEQARGFNTGLVLAAAGSRRDGRQRGSAAHPRQRRDDRLSPRQHARRGDRARRHLRSDRVRKPLCAVGADGGGHDQDSAPVQGRSQPGAGACTRRGIRDQSRPRDEGRGPQSTRYTGAAARRKEIGGG
jgi:hypothetical protein